MISDRALLNRPRHALYVALALVLACTEQPTESPSVASPRFAAITNASGLVTFSFEGVIGLSCFVCTSGSSSFGSGVAPGTRLSGSFTFDPTAQPTATFEPNRVAYTGVAVTVTVGAETVTGNDPSKARIEIANGPPQGDSYSLLVEGGFSSGTIAGRSIDQFVWVVGGTSSLFSDTSLPTTPGFFSPLLGSRVCIGACFAGTILEGDISSLTAGNDMLDQSFTSPYSLSSAINECCAFVGQTYTAGVTGTLAGVSIDVHSSSAFPLHVAIRTVSGGLPTTIVLGDVTLNSSSSALSQLIVFPQSIPQVAGVQYAIVVNYAGAPPQGPGQAQGQWAGATGNAYAGGDLVISYDGGVSWVVEPPNNLDEHFQTFVTPATPQDAIQSLMADVRSLVSEGVLSAGRGDGLIAKLAAAVPSLNRGSTKAACNQLGAFVNQVNGLIRAGKLTAAAAQDLIDAAEGIRNQIGCVTTILLAKLSQTHTCAIVQGVTYCWGNNSNGQLGNGTTMSSSIPVKVVSPLNFSALIEAGTGTIGLTGNQTYYTWGLTPSATSSTTPVLDQGLTAKSLSQLATGYNFACGIAPDHLAYCWGNNESGQLGDGTTTPRYVIGPPVGSGLQFVSLSSSSSLTHMCGLTATGKAYCWGFNFFGQLGDGTLTDRMSPVAVSTSLNFVELATGSFHTCARTASDELYCWGTMPGVPTGSTPTLIGREPSLIGIVSGQAGSCVLTTAGEARCWGGNGWGTIGDGTWTDRSTPTTVVGGISFAALSMGAGHVCGVTRDNEMYCWGFNDLGQLGDGTTTNRNTPQPVLLPSLP